MPKKPCPDGKHKFNLVKEDGHWFGPLGTTKGNRRIYKCASCGRYLAKDVVFFRNLSKKKGQPGPYVEINPMKI